MAARNFEPSASFAARMDAEDPLAKFRERFHFPKGPEGGDSVYFVGHSLGLQPKTARAYVEQELKSWETLGVEGHFHGDHPWTQYHRLLRDSSARLVGAKPSEVVVMNTLTVNLHLMMVSFYRPTRQRYKILIEGSAFPSDQYAVKSQLHFHGYDPSDALIELRPRAGEMTLRDEDILALIEREGSSIALILMGGLNYSSGQVFDMGAITEAGHAQGSVVGFDLAHAAGNIPLRLHDWGVDFAVWCTYKYLNGGPGSIAGCFVNERYATDRGLPRFAGWWGNDDATRFKMGPDFVPIAGAEGWQQSNPPILSLAALRASLDIFEEATIERLREKSLSLTGYLESLLDAHASEKFSILTPRDPSRRGAQLSLRITSASRAICDRLIAKGVFCDWREPDILRFAPVPLYNSYEDAYRCVQTFLALLD